MALYVCDSCGNQMKKPDKAALFSAWQRCKCGAKAYEIDAEAIQKSGSPWAVSGGFAGEGKGSVSRARPDFSMEEQMAHDRKTGVGHLVDWKRDPKHPRTFRPMFRSRAARKKWDRANGQFDSNSYD